MSNGGGSDFLTVALLLFAGYCVLFWIGQLVILAATAAYFIILFGTFALTALSLATWKHRITVGHLSLGPEQSQPFIVRGVVGALLLPAFALFCELFLDVRVQPKWWPHLAAAGYALGSVGIGMVEDGLVGDARDYGPVIDHEARSALPGSRPSRNDATDMTPRDGPKTGPKPEQPKRACQCFTFASWDDEEALRGRGKPDVL